MKTPIIYTPNWIVKPQEMFETLWVELPWVRHAKVPRRECYFNDIPVAYTYGNPNFARTYEPSPNWHPIVRNVQQLVEEHLGERMEVCFLNGYEDGTDQLGYHADDSPEMDDTRSIAIISLGAEREIWFRQNLANSECHICSTTVGKTHGELCSAEPGIMPESYAKECQKLSLEKVSLGNGSLCIMKPGMQDTHEHRIPKSHLHNCSPRISFTFRGFVSH